MIPTFHLHEIAELLHSHLEKPPQDHTNDPIVIERLAPIAQAGPRDISFLADDKYEKYIYDTHAAAVIVPENFQPQQPLSTHLLRVKNVHASLGILLEATEKKLSDMNASTQAKIGVEQPSHLGEDTQIGHDVYRGAFSYIGSHAQIGNHVKIYPHVYIGDYATIGDHTTLYAGVKIHARTQIGAYCRLHEGAVIGCEGFGFHMQANGKYKVLPHIGHVILEDHVSIGANTTIDRATFDLTRIEEGVIIDNLVQIGHNVQVGAHSAMAAQVGIAGSAKIGQHVVIGGQAGISGHLHIDNHTTIAPQAGVTKNTRTEKTTLVGGPARPYRQFIKDQMNLHHLEKLREKVEALEKKLENGKTS